MLREMDPFLRRVIRLRLLDGRLRRAVDTTDILQSLLKDFLRNPRLSASLQQANLRGAFMSRRPPPIPVTRTCATD